MYIYIYIYIYICVYICVCVCVCMCVWCANNRVAGSGNIRISEKTKCPEFEFPYSKSHVFFGIFQSMWLWCF